MKRRTQFTAGLAIMAVAGGLAQSSFAIEGGASFYLLGGKLPLSGVVPGPGMYFDNELYGYSGNVGGNIQLPFGGQIIADVEATLVFEAPTFIYMTPLEILGGRLGFAGLVPLGYADIEAAVGPLSVQDDVFTVGDPVPGVLLGWDAGNFHWSLGTTVNVPIGDYQEGEIANISLNRWAVDVTGAITWFDPALGWDLSAAVGLTFNGENDATDYDSGNELHLEAAITKHFTRAFSLGLAGYYNHQISDDSGAGATLGAFRGEVVAIGGIGSYTFEVGQTPVTATLRYYHELEAENRLEGDAMYISLALPLWMPSHSQ